MLINFDWILIICQRHSLIFEFTWIIFYILIVTLWCRVPFHRCGNWGLGRFGTLTKITQVVSSVTEIQDNVVYIAACSLSVLHLTLVCCSVAKSCPTVCDPMGYSTSGFPVPHHLLEFAQVHVHCIMMPSSHLILWCPLLLLQSFPASGSFPRSQFFTSGGQSIRALASASVLPMNIQDWFPLGLTGCISSQSKGLSRVFSSTTVQKHQFFGVQPSLWSTSHLHTWLLERT